jgi:hypothetical protein
MSRAANLGGLLLLASVAACQPSAAPPTIEVPTVSATSAAAGSPGATSADTVATKVAIASSDLAVGHDRFAFSLLDASGALLEDAKAQVTFFHLDGEVANAAGTSEAAFYPAQLEPAGLYVVYHDFDRVGPWGAEIAAALPDGRSIIPQRVRFEVQQQPKSLGVGAAPPPTANRTLATEPDLAKLTSDPAPDPELYQMTVDEAVASGKPSVVVFSTPGHCQSRICGPVLDEVKAVKQQIGDAANFLHLEVYKQFDPLVLADEMGTWGLQTEPWVYVLGRDGKVAERLEGSVTAAELAPIVQRLVDEPAAAPTPGG